MTTETEKLPSIVSSVLIPRKDKNVKEALDVFFCFDDAFCLPTGISAFSVLENNKTLPLNVHLVGVDVSDKNLELQAAELLSEFRNPFSLPDGERV